MRKPKLSIFAVVVFCLITGNAIAASSSGSSRTANRLGAYVSILGDPFVSMFGANIGVNLTDFLRVNGGAGATVTGIINGNTYGGSAKLFIPGWNLSPFIGYGYSVVKVDFLGLVSKTFTGVTYVQGGLDWTADIGFNFGIGVNKSINLGKVGAVPFLHFGWYF